MLAAFFVEMEVQLAAYELSPRHVVRIKAWALERRGE